MQRELDDFILVEDAELQRAVRVYLERAKTLAELAGAASLAGAWKLKDRVRGKAIALMLSGGNIAPERLQQCLAN